MDKPEVNKTMNNNNSTKTNVNCNKYYNLLLLGPTGVGKSTFINAFVNYLMYDTLRTAKNVQPVVLIKSKFVVTDENLVEKVISVTAETNISNESGVLGDSATQETKVYTFPILDKKKFLRLIDTPGIGDTRGIQQDELNCEDILQKTALYDKIHAICILLKPNNARLTAEFEYSIKQLLSLLDKSATDNIIFVFTNSRSSFYRPGDTLTALQRLLQNIREQLPYVDVPLRKENTFCIDNEAFRFLMAMKQVNYSYDEISEFEKSWDVSREVCLRLLSYIMGDKNKPGLKPHPTKNTMSINEVRRLIMQLLQHPPDISQLIRDKVEMKKLNGKDPSLNELNKIIVQQVEEHEVEHDIILNSLATFARFLKNNAITASNDAYRTYIGYLIDCEQFRGDKADQFTINNLQAASQRYEKYKEILDGAKTNSETSVNAATITDLTHRLFGLKHCGIKIKELYESQTCAHDVKRKNFEYIHPTSLSLNAETPASQTYKQNRKSNAQKLQSKVKSDQNRAKSTSLQKDQKQTQSYKGKLQSSQEQKQQQQNQQRNRRPRKNHHRSPGLLPPGLPSHLQPPLPHALPPPPPPPHFQVPPQIQSPPRRLSPPPYCQPPPYFQQPPPPQQTSNWQQQAQLYNNYQQRPPPNHYNNSPNYQNYPQGPPFNFSPKGNHQNLQNQMAHYFPHQQQQFTPSLNQQHTQKKYNHSGPSKENSISSEAGSSKIPPIEAPTCIYKPKPKQNAEINTTAQSLEQQFSFMKVQGPTDTTPGSNTNKKKRKRPRHRNLKKRQGHNSNSLLQERDSNKNKADDDDEESYDPKGPIEAQDWVEIWETELIQQPFSPPEQKNNEGSTLNTNKKKIKRPRHRNLKKKLGHNCNLQLQERNSNKNKADDDDNYDLKGPTEAQGCAEILKIELIQQPFSAPGQKNNKGPTLNPNKKKIKRRRNLKKRQGLSCNSHLQGRNSNKTVPDDDNQDNYDPKGLIEAQGFVEVPELIQQMIAVAAVEPLQSLPEQREIEGDSCQQSKTGPKKKALISFFRKLFN